jgi:propionyl-CoA synthetase
LYIDWYDISPVFITAGVPGCHELLSVVMRERIGPIASFKEALVVKRLPKTRSGKILRGTIKKIADGVQYNVPATIDDPVILDEIRASLAERGFPKH